MASCSRYGFILTTILLVFTSSKYALANRYDDEEAINRAAQQLNQIEQSERERAKREYNYKHGVIPGTAAEDWKQIQYNAERKKEEEKRSAPPAASSNQTPAYSTTSTDSSAGIIVTVLILALIAIGYLKFKPASSTNKSDLTRFSEPTKKCHFCAETIKKEAIVCRYCGKDQPKPESPPVEKIHDLTTDDQNRVKCPLCGSETKLGMMDLHLCHFTCSSCKEDIRFSPTT